MTFVTEYGSIRGFTTLCYVT